MSRSIIVDDNDSGIIYSGAWFKDDSGALDSMGNFGSPMLGTLHGTRSNGSFTYTFSGTEFIVTTSNQSGDASGLNITCLIDNESLPVGIYTTLENNLLLCTQDRLADTEHTFVLNAVVTNKDTFWFDYLSYVPSASIPLDKAPSLITEGDAQLQNGMGAGWNTFSPGFQTTENGAQFDFAFTGVSLTYYGFYNSSLPWDTSLKTATYSVDGGPPVSFNTQTDVASRMDKPTGVRNNQLLFQTDDLPNGNHTLHVTYQGTNTSTPLTLQALLVNPNPRDSGTGSTITISVPLSSNAPTSPNNDPPKKASNLGAMVGAIVGAAVVVVVLAVLFVLLRRRHKHRHGVQRPTGILAPDIVDLVRPFDSVLAPRHLAYAHYYPSKAGPNTHNVHALPIHSQAMDPFSDTMQHASASSNSRSHPSPSAKLYGSGAGQGCLETRPPSYSME